MSSDTPTATNWKWLDAYGDVSRDFLSAASNYIAASAGVDDWINMFIVPGEATIPQLHSPTRNALQDSELDRIFDLFSQINVDHHVILVDDAFSKFHTLLPASAKKHAVALYFAATLRIPLEMLYANAKWATWLKDVPKNELQEAMNEVAAHDKQKTVTWLIMLQTLQDRRPHAPGSPEYPPRLPPPLTMAPPPTTSDEGRGVIAIPVVSKIRALLGEPMHAPIINTLAAFTSLRYGGAHAGNLLDAYVKAPLTPRTKYRLLSLARECIGAPADAFKRFMPLQIRSAKPNSRLDAATRTLSRGLTPAQKREWNTGEALHTLALALVRNPIEEWRDRSPLWRLHPETGRALDEYRQTPGEVPTRTELVHLFISSVSSDSQ